MAFYKRQNDRNRKHLQLSGVGGEGENLAAKGLHEGIFRVMECPGWDTVRGYVTLSLCQNPCNCTPQRVRLELKKESKK